MSDLLIFTFLMRSVSCLVASDSLWPRGLWPASLLRPWNSPGKNTEVSCHVLLQGIFLTQGSNLSLLCCRQILYCLGHQGREMVFHCLHLHPPDSWRGWAYYPIFTEQSGFTYGNYLFISFANFLVAFLLFLLLLKDFVNILDPKSFANHMHCRCFSRSVACLLNLVFQLSVFNSIMVSTWTFVYVLCFWSLVEEILPWDSSLQSSG